MENKQNTNSTVLAMSIVTSFICGTLGSYLVITNVPSVSKSIVENVSKVELTENSIALAVEKAYDSVVTVVSYKNGSQIGTGSGFVYKKDNNVGYIMTNNHVVDGADSVEVVLSSNKTVEAKVLGKETYSDVAVLSINEKEVLSVMEIGNTEKLKLGDTVFTIGAPMGLEYSGTVTKGILSGKERLVEVSFSGNVSDYYMKVLQTDAAINPGNSGGPLLNINGEVIGINSLKIVQDKVEGMGFSIPIEDAIYYASFLEKGETIKRPFIGISMIDVNQKQALWQYGISIPKETTKGVVVLETQKGSPADNKLAKADIIIGINNEEVSTVAELRYELYKHEPGETIKIKYLRDDKENTVEITLTENKES